MARTARGWTQRVVAARLDQLRRRVGILRFKDGPRRNRMKLRLGTHVIGTLPRGDSIKEQVRYEPAVWAEVTAQNAGTMTDATAPEAGVMRRAAGMRVAAARLACRRCRWRLRIHGGRLICRRKRAGRRTTEIRIAPRQHGAIASARQQAGGDKKSECRQFECWHLTARPDSKASSCIGARGWKSLTNRQNLRHRIRFPDFRAPSDGGRSGGVAIRASRRAAKAVAAGTRRLARVNRTATAAIAARTASAIAIPRQ
jgi:hypothetical protein